MAQDIGTLLSKYGNMFLQGSIATIVLSIIGTFGGLFIGVFIAFGKNLETKNRPVFEKILKWPVKTICYVYSVILRGTPMMVQALLFKYSCQALGVNWNNVLKGVDTWNGWLIAGAIVITLNTAAYMAEIVQSGLNGIDVGQVEGGKSIGMSNFQILFHITLPQAIRNSIPTIGNEWVVNIKDSSVLNVISVSELFWQSNAAASKNYMYLASYIIIAIIYLLMTLGTSLILKIVEYFLDGKKPKFDFIKAILARHHKTAKETGIN